MQHALRTYLDHLVAYLYQLGVTHWVISPGSRNAPIVAGLLRHGGFDLVSAPDERSAAFMALGYGIGTRKPAAVLCTSGTAALNLYPAIAEAYYQRVPLIAVTADRPEHLIDQWDGQTIQQLGIFHEHVVGSFATSEAYAEALESLPEWLHTMVALSLGAVEGPVHLNVPIADPIYEGIGLPFQAPESPIALQLPSSVFSSEIGQELLGKRTWIAMGAFDGKSHLPDALCENLTNHSVVMADVLSGNRIACPMEPFWFLQNPATIEPPELLITIGTAFLSKKFKAFLRENPPKQHLHISPGGWVGDPFESQPLHITHVPSEWLTAWIEASNQQVVPNMWTAYYENMRIRMKDSAIQFQLTALEHPQSEAALMHGLMQIQSDHPLGASLVFANSMSIRYAAYFAPPFHSPFYGNRGTSGIDGSVSTAIGLARSEPSKKWVLVTGDIGFLYDKNAWWTQPMPDNLLVLVVNNGKGEIFDLIPGPSSLPALQPFIQTPHQRTAYYAAAEAQIPFKEFYEVPRLIEAVAQWLKDEKSNTAIWEIFTQSGLNAAFFEGLKMKNR